MSATDHLSPRDAWRFVWHCEIHPSHANDVWYDVRAEVVRCNRCGKTWGGKR